jgi:hypothetical protein
VSPRPFAVIQFDVTYINPVGKYKYLVNFVCLFSKFAWSYPLVKNNAKSVAASLKKVLDSLPEGAQVSACRSDNGGENAGETEELLKERGIKSVKSLPASPMSQGAIESFQRTIKSALFSFGDSKKNMAHLKQRLERAVFIYNHSVHSATNFAPFVLADPNLPSHIKKKVKNFLNRKAEQANPNGRYNRPLSPGDKVRLDVSVLDSNIKQLRKAGKYKASHFASFGKELYTVKKQDGQGFVTLVEKPGFKYMRGEVLAIPKLCSV